MHVWRCRQVISYLPSPLNDHRTFRAGPLLVPNCSSAVSTRPTGRLLIVEVLIVEVFGCTSAPSAGQQLPPEIGLVAGGLPFVPFAGQPIVMAGLTLVRTMLAKEAHELWPPKRGCCHPVLDQL